MRGSAYYSNAERITSHYRAHNPPEHRAPAIGFRVARSL
jgi:formylglycine-generating enzyme required for sulfatase activity